MNIFQKIGLISKANKAYKEVKLVLDSNNAIVDKIIEIVNDIIELLNKLKDLLPQVGDFIDAIIEIIKKWFKK